MRGLPRTPSTHAGGCWAHLASVGHTRVGVRHSAVPRLRPDTRQVIHSSVRLASERFLVEMRCAFDPCVCQAPTDSVLARGGPVPIRSSHVPGAVQPLHRIPQPPTLNTKRECLAALGVCAGTSAVRCNMAAPAITGAQLLRNCLENVTVAGRRL